MKPTVSVSSAAFAAVAFRGFDGGVDTIAPDKIQLTRSLLFLGGHQAAEQPFVAPYAAFTGPTDENVRALRDKVQPLQQFLKAGAHVRVRIDLSEMPIGNRLE